MRILVVALVHRLPWPATLLPSRRRRRGGAVAARRPVTLAGTQLTWSLSYWGDGEPGARRP